MPDRPPPPGAVHPLFPPPPRPAPVRVIVADDNPVVRAGLTALLRDRDDIAVVAEAADGREACEAAVRHRPDVVLLDVRMPGVDGLSALPHLARIAHVLMLTYSHEAGVVQRALRGGAGGYLVHGEFTVEELASAVRDVTVGRAHFTPTAATAVLAHIQQSATAHDEADPVALFSLTSERIAFAVAIACESICGGGRREIRAQREGGGDHGSHRVGHEQPADRRHLLHQREDGQEPHQPHLRQAAQQQPLRGRGQVAGDGRGGAPGEGWGETGDGDSGLGPALGPEALSRNGRSGLRSGCRQRHRRRASRSRDTRRGTA